MLHRKPVGLVSPDAKFNMCRQRLKPIIRPIGVDGPWLRSDPNLVPIPIGHARKPHIIDRPDDVWNDPSVLREAVSGHESAKETLKNIGIA
jgi:hypothetical protein